MPEPSTVTELLVAHGQGNPGAFDRLVEVVYDDLRRIAHVQLRRASRRAPRGDLSPAGQGLETTALVNELYLKLVDQERGWSDRGHFFAACATAMRHILVDAARHQTRQKRGGAAQEVPLETARAASEGDAEWLLGLDRVMNRLAEHDSRLVRVFECRYFAGYSAEETAEALGLSLRTTQRDWGRARAWLKQALAAAAPLGERDE
jgi:RNA polymerase sigma factor (TIGR02999 family)